MQSWTILVLVALIVGVPIGLYLGVMAWCVALEVFGMCRTHPHNQAWEPEATYDADAIHEARVLMGLER